MFGLLPGSVDLIIDALIIVQFGVGEPTTEVCLSTDVLIRNKSFVSFFNNISISELIN